MSKTGKKKNVAGKGAKKSVIASRKSCKATGTGLSHYIVAERKAR